MKLALVLVCLMAAAGQVSARRALLTDPVALNPPPCDVDINDFGTVYQGTSSAGNGDLPKGDASKFYLVKGPNDGGVPGRCARVLCKSFGSSIGLQLQVANLEANNVRRVAGNLLINNIGTDGAYINTAPGYETPRDLADPKKKSAGPVGRNNLVLTAQNDGGAYDVTPPSINGQAFHPGPGDQSLAVVCGPSQDPVEQPPPICISPNPEFEGWGITTMSFAAANIQCPFGYALGNAKANNLFKSDQTKPNPDNLYDGTGFPLLQNLISLCAPGERVWVNTAPGFTSGNPSGSPQGAPGYCVTISEGAKGQPQGVDPKTNGGKPKPDDPKCQESHRALCFQSSAV